MRGHSEIGINQLKGGGKKVNTITLIPAYGRDYHSKADVLADWEANKDFIIANVTHRYMGKPANRSQIEEAHPTSKVKLRYHKQQRAVFVE